jgi:hypothetical protein
MSNFALLFHNAQAQFISELPPSHTRLPFLPCLSHFLQTDDFWRDYDRLKANPLQIFVEPHQGKMFF